MAAAPVKHLHNFPLSLKWESLSQPLRPDSDSEAEANRSSSRTVNPTPCVGSRSARHHRFSFAACSASLPHKKSRSRPSPSNPLTIPSEDHLKSPTEPEDDDESLRHWNLRSKKQNGALPPIEIQKPLRGIAMEPKSLRLRGMADSSFSNCVGGLGLGLGSNCEIRKEKRKIWIALSREEIEEDVFIMTGSRPARRPKKRPKNVQKVLDTVFPGLWLVGVAAESYRIAETPARGR